MDTCFGWNVEAISYSWFLTTANRLDDSILNSVIFLFIFLFFFIFILERWKIQWIKANNKMQNEMAEWMYGINKWMMSFSWEDWATCRIHIHTHTHNSYMDCVIACGTDKLTENSRHAMQEEVIVVHWVRCGYR